MFIPIVPTRLILNLRLPLPPAPLPRAAASMTAITTGRSTYRTFPRGSPIELTGAPSTTTTMGSSRSTSSARRTSAVPATRSPRPSATAGSSHRRRRRPPTRLESPTRRHLHRQGLQQRAMGDRCCHLPSLASCSSSAASSSRSSFAGRGTRIRPNEPCPSTRLAHTLPLTGATPSRARPCPPVNDPM